VQAITQPFEHILGIEIIRILLFLAAVGFIILYSDRYTKRIAEGIIQKEFSIFKTIK
jgi:hypothetical protein